MKKTLFSVVAVCAACVAAADVYTNLFTGVSSVSAEGVPTAIGGTWSTTGVSLSNEGGAVGFETGEGSLMSLDVTAEPADTNTIVRVELVVTVEDVGDLTTPGIDAQTAFAVSTNSFNVWNGSVWLPLNELPEGFDASEGTNLLVEISYQRDCRMARYTLGETVLSLRSTGEQWVPLSTSADNITGFACSGSGVLTSANGSVMLGVASYDNVKYGTLSAAVAAAESAETVGSSVVEVLRETDESVNLTKSGVVIADNGKMSGGVTVPEGSEVKVKADESVFASSQLAGKSGEYSFDLNVSGGKVNVLLPDSMSNKEVASVAREGSTVKVVIQTAAAVLGDAKPDGATSLTNKIAELRQFLAANAAEAYEAAGVSAATIASALSASGANGVPLYQSYALGVDPSASLKPVPVASDESETAVTLQIPALLSAVSSGDYKNIRYVVVKDGVEKASTSAAGAIGVPLETGSYSVKIVFE